MVVVRLIGAVSFCGLPSAHSVPVDAGQELRLQEAAVLGTRHPPPPYFIHTWLLFSLVRIKGCPFDAVPTQTFGYNSAHNMAYYHPHL